MTLLAGTIQPQLLTLLNTASSPALSPLWRSHNDSSPPDDSLITTLPDTATKPCSKWDQRPGFTYVPKHPSRRGDIEGDVVHLQSPDVGGTWIQAGLSVTEHRRRRAADTRRNLDDKDDPEAPLGVELGWIGWQIKRLGRRHFSLEVGIVDAKGREGVVRCSTFKTRPSLHVNRDPPLIHLPLVLPEKTATTMTPWLEFNMNLSTLMPLFQTLPQGRAAADGKEQYNARRQKKRKITDLPSGQFAHVSYVRVYANCRVRRIWLSAEGDRTLNALGSGVREEWGLHAAGAVDV